MSQQSFADLGVSDAVVRALAARGVTAPFDVQRSVVPDVLAGHGRLIAAFVLVIKDLKLGVHRREREQLATLPGLRQTIEADCLILATGKGLTKRELETACDLSMGMSVKTIAEMRGVSENTVKTHAAHAYRKLDVHSREELMDLVRDVDEARISGGLMDGVSAGS